MKAGAGDYRRKRVREREGKRESVRGTKSTREGERERLRDRERAREEEQNRGRERCWTGLIAPSLPALALHAVPGAYQTPAAGPWADSQAPVCRAGTHRDQERPRCQGPCWGVSAWLGTEGSEEGKTDGQMDIGSRHVMCDIHAHTDAHSQVG